MVHRRPVPIIGGRTRACGGIGRRARLRALWGVSPVGVRVSLGALSKPACPTLTGRRLGCARRLRMPSSNDDTASLDVSAEDFLAAALETAGQPIWVVDPAG